MFGGIGLCFAPGEACLIIGVCNPVTRDCE
jgi:hypothetical protein